MSKNKRSAKKVVAQPAKKSSHLNFKNLGILSAVFVGLGLAVWAYKSYTSRGIKESALAQARQSLERHEGDLALRHLDQFLASNPDDIDTLELKASILSRSAVTADRIDQAAKVHDLLIRLDPNGSGRLATRRRLIELYLMYGELVRSFADDLNANQIAINESRYLAAIEAANELIHYKDPKTGVENGTVDAAAHRLKAMAYMGQVPGLIVKKPEDAESLKIAKTELELSLKMDPYEILASEKLAELYLVNAKDPVTAEKTLDQMLEIVQNKDFGTDAEAKRKALLMVRLARFRAFHRSKDKPSLVKAQEELKDAMELSPLDIDLRTSAAGLALQLNQPDRCRRILDQIPKERQDDLRVRFLRGALEFADRHPEEAIDQWRRGLTLVGGSDIDLTWKLASNLIQINRLNEARPLVDQYLRLAKPGDALGLYLDGMFQEKSGYINNAIELMEKASNLVTLSFKSDVLMSLGHCYELKGDENKAKFAYKQAADLGGSATGPRRALARLYLSSDPLRAIQLLEEAYSSSKALAAREDSQPNGEKIYFGDPNVLIDLIKIKMDRQARLAKADRDFSEVSRLLEEARKIAPNNPIFQGLLAQYQALDNKMDLAVKTLENTVKGANRTRLESWLAWAEGLETLGRLEDAIDVLDRATASDAAGDHAAIRTMKARILLRMNLGSRAKEVLTTNLDNIPKSERPDLSKALGDLLQELGNRVGAREAYLEWSRLSPESPFPALKLLSIAQVDGDEEASKAGLEALTRLGRDNEPYALAARALQYLRTDPSKPGPPPAERIAKAQDLVKDLDRKAPDFPVKFMIQGMIYEAQADPKNPQQWRECLTKAGENYRKSIKPGNPSPALPKLIEIYMRLKDTDKLNLLKLEYDDGTQRHKTETAMEFDRYSTMIALKLGDRDRAKTTLGEMHKSNPENREIRFAEAKMFEADGNFLEAEAQLKDLVKIRPADRMTWIELIRFNKNHRSAGDVAKAIDQARQNYTGDRPELFLAECYWNGNDIPNATSQFQKAVDAMPDDLVTLQTLILFRDSTNQRDQIDSVFRKILKLDPKNTWASRGLAMRLTNKADPVSWAEAWSLVAPGAPGTSDKAEDRLIRATVMARSLEIARRAEAFQAFESLANDLPISNAIGIEARLRLSQALLEIDRPAEAWQHINPICDDLTRPNALALAIGIEALARQGKAEEADYRLTRLALQIPNSGQLAISRAWVLSAQNKKQEAADLIVATYDRAEKEPEGEAVGENLLNLLLKFHNLDAAKTIAQKMTARWPAQVRNLAKVQLARAEYDDVLVSCKSALEQGTPREAITYAAEAAIARRLDPVFLKKVEDLGILARGKSPKDHFILICMATVYHLQAKYDQEIAFYRMALELSPEKRQFLNNMAWTLSEGLSQPEEGLKWIEELLKREGPTPQYLDTRGVIQTRLKNYDQAIADLEKSVQLDPAPMTYFHLARAYQKAGKLNESRRCSAKFREAKIDIDSLDPTDRSDLIEVMGSP